MGTSCHSRACSWTPGLFLDSLSLQRACFGPSLSSGGLFLVSLFLRGPVSGPPLSSTDMFLEPLCLVRACFWNPCVFHGPVLGLLCLPRACFYMSFVFRGRVFGLPLLCLPPWVCFWIPSLGSLVVRFGAPFWCRWSVLGLRFGASGASWGFRLVDFHGTILQTPQIQCPKA